MRHGIKCKKENKNWLYEKHMQKHKSKKIQLNYSLATKQYNG